MLDSAEGVLLPPEATLDSAEGVLLPPEAMLDSVDGVVLPVEAVLHPVEEGIRSANRLTDATRERGRQRFARFMFAVGLL